jgi:dihydrofolate reductase
LITSNAADFVQRLKRWKGKGIALFGGGELAKSLFEAGLIDEIVLNVHPIILGSGIPLFHEMKQQIDLQFFKARLLKDGGVVLSYRVKH